MLSLKTTHMEHYLKKLQRTVVSNWDRPSVSNYKGESFTYCQTATRIARLHVLYDRLGLQDSDKVAICARNSARWAIAFLSSNTYGTVTVPILNDFLPDSIASLTNHSGSAVLFTDAEIWDKLDPENIPGVRCVLNCADFSLLYARDEATLAAYRGVDAAFETRYPDGFGPSDVRYPDFALDRLAIINYTSGTTSAPKGVMITYGNLTATVDYSQSHVHSGPEDSLVSILPLAHMYGLAIEFLYPCCSGCPIYFLGRTPSPTLLMKAMKDVRPYMVVTVPLVMEKVYKSSIKPVVSKWYMKILLSVPGISNLIYGKIRGALMEAFGGRVRIFIMGGAALNPEVERCFKRMKFPYMVGYGMTEAAPLLGWEWWEQFVPGSCGKPCHQVRIDSEDPQHIAGEIQAKGPNICVGYYNNPEAQAMLFTEDGWLRTGDLGIMDAAGNIFIKGRSKSMILTANGQNVYPEELEAVVNNQPYVAESLVLDRNGKIVALIYLDKDLIRRDALDSEAVSDIPERVRISSNRLLPAYSQITKVEVMAAPFEKTPKLSIKRFLYK